MAVRDVLAAALFASTLPMSAPAAPPRTQMVTFRLVPARIDRTLKQMVADGRIAGASVLIWQHGREAYFGSAGFADREARKSIRRDTLFQVWSMTKPVTGVGLMRLWEEGKFGLDEPLAKYLPEYADTKVFVGLDAAGQPILTTPDRPILIRDILRHTAGFAYWAGPAYSEQMLAKVDPFNLNNTLAEFSQKLATIPLMFEPGSQWRYSAAVDVQARLIEKLSGEPFETYMRENVLAPLGMKDSGWTEPESRFSRLATAYEVGPDHKLRRKSEKDIRPLNAKENRGSTGEFFWDGAWTTLFWVDPANDMAVVFMVQKDPYDFSLHHDIRAAVYGADYLGPAGD